MKKFCAAGGLLLAATLLFAGCHKKPPGNPAPVAEGVQVDAAKFQQAFAANKDQAIDASVVKIASGWRYGYDLNSVLFELDKLSQNPNLTEPQKKAVGDAIEQTKQSIASKGATPK